MEGLLVNQGSNCSGMAHGYQIWYEEPLTKVQCIAGVKCHAGVSWGQIRQECPGLPNLIEPLTEK